jgi:metal-responsive CopG/Arc/MetJ family transcriptional regulator
MFGLRISNELMTEIAKWAEANDTNRSEAIRRLVELGLKANGSDE